MRAHGYRYFLAFRPPQHLVGTIAAMRDHCAPASPVSDTRLHVTAQGIAALDDRNPEIASALDMVLRDHGLPACWLAFDQLRSNAVAATLQIGGGRDPLRDFRAALVRRAGAHGLQLPYRRNRRPHITLAYGPLWQGSAPIAPICWLADELVLIESWQGRHIHRLLRRWRLHPPARQRRFAFDMQTHHGLSVS